MPIVSARERPPWQSCSCSRGPSHPSPSRQSQPVPSLGRWTVGPMDGVSLDHPGNPWSICWNAAAIRIIVRCFRSGNNVMCVTESCGHENPKGKGVRRPGPCACPDLRSARPPAAPWHCATCACSCSWFLPRALASVSSMFSVAPAQHALAQVCCCGHCGPLRFFHELPHEFAEKLGC